MLGRVGGDFGRMGLVRPAGHLAGASLDLNFVASSGYPAAPSLLLTTTRSSSGDYADNSAGVWSSFAANIPRITDKGLLVEEARTNSIRNNSMQGAGAGSPGTLPTNWFVANLRGLTQTVVGTGTSRGIEYVDVRFSGTTNATSTLNFFFEANSTIAAVEAQSWTHSVFVAIVGGSTANLTGMTINTAAYDAVPTYLSEVFTPVTIAGASATLARFTGTGSAPTSTAWIVPYIQLTFNNAVAIDITLRVGWPQLELGAFATSPIRTTAAAATRAADVVVGPAVSVGSALTLFAEMTAGDGAAAVQAAFQVDNGSTTDRVFLWRSGTALNGNVRNSSVDTAALAGGAIANNATGKMAIAVAANDAAFCPNGGTVLTDATVTFPSGLNRVVFGQNGASGVTLNGYLRRVAYFPTRLTNAQLQALTA